MVGYILDNRDSHGDKGNLVVDKKDQTGSEIQIEGWQICWMWVGEIRCE